MLELTCQKHSIADCPICSPGAIQKTGQSQGTGTNNSVETPASSISSLTTNSAGATSTGIGSQSQNAPDLASSKTILPLQGTAGTPTSTAKSGGSKRTTTSSSASIKEDSKTKKIRTTLIDDEVACEIFRELDLTDAFLNSGKVLAWGLDPEDEAFINIHNYVRNSQGESFGVKVLSILRVMSRADTLQGESPVLDFKDDPKVAGQQRMMLWHGTQKCNVASILENGFRIPAHFGSFGKGIYFADRVAKSAVYSGCFGQPGRIGYLFLCDVLVGNIYEASQSMMTNSAAPTTNYNWLWTKMGYDPVKNQSVKGRGWFVPNPSGNKNIEGCVWPMGKTISKLWEWVSSYRLQNEYVVYDTKQVQPKYLVKVECTKKPVNEKLE